MFSATLGMLWTRFLGTEVASATSTSQAFFNRKHLCGWTRHEKKVTISSDSSARNEHYSFSRALLLMFRNSPYDMLCHIQASRHVDSECASRT
jgi:hypothetical protein